MRFLVTGSSGFIGFHTSLRLLQSGHEVCGYDSMNDYYPVQYKEGRLKVLRDFEGFRFQQGLLEDKQVLTKTWDDFQPERVLNLAAQAGVRYSLENPMAYVQANMVGFQNVIDLVRERKPQNFVYASSSSVYGSIEEMPFRESQNVDRPISLYAASKIANELVARTYNHLFDVPSTGLRFFTVYGPYSRPDMAMFKFAELMRQGKKIPVFNNGEMQRDFTFISDIVDGILAALDKPEAAAVYNLGKGSTEKLMDMIQMLEQQLDLRADKDMLPMQPGDVPKTYADVSLARERLGYNPKVTLKEGVQAFGQWYRETCMNSDGAR